MGDRERRVRGREMKEGWRGSYRMCVNEKGFNAGRGGRVDAVDMAR